MQTPWRHISARILALIFLFAGTSAVSAKEGSPRVAPDATAHHFGKVPRGTVVTGRFIIRNVGEAPLLIQGMEFSTPGMRARVAATIEPGGSTELEIAWDTSQYTRDAEGRALLLLNDPDTPRLVLTMTGFVVSPIDVEPVPAFYLSQFQGDAAVQSVTIRNNRDRAVRITGTEQRGESFTLSVETIESGRVYTVTAAASRDLAPGEYRESAVVFTDDPERSRIRLYVNILVKRDIHASVEAIDFGRFRIASVRANPSLLGLLQQTVILEARSTDMRIVEIESGLPFITLNHEPEGPAKRIRIDVGLDPEKLRVGEHSGNLRIHTSVDALPVVTVPIKVSIVD